MAGDYHRASCIVITIRMNAFSQDGGKPSINCRILIASVV